MAWPPLCNLDKRFENRHGVRRPCFWPKTGLNLSENPFFFGLLLSLGWKTYLVLGWKIFILVFIILKFSEFPAPPLSKILRTLLPVSDMFEFTSLLNTSPKLDICTFLTISFCPLPLLKPWLNATCYGFRSFILRYLCPTKSSFFENF